MQRTTDDKGTNVHHHHNHIDINDVNRVLEESLSSQERKPPYLQLGRPTHWHQQKRFAVPRLPAFEFTGGQRKQTSPQQMPTPLSRQTNRASGAAYSKAERTAITKRESS
ncbi:hypothetical protein NBRC116584_21420 [Hydrogenophaga sp. 5NK40-0174]